MKNKILSLTAATVLLGTAFTSCNDWLDVKMEDQVMENTLFSNYNGYMSTLNGVYLRLNELYGSTLNAVGLDAMAQYYNVKNDKHTSNLFGTFKYDQSEFESYSTEVWSKAYELLGNVNVLLENTVGEHPLNARQLAIIRGEALALRAMIHFDLLRLYGPIYSENPTAVSIPYQESSERQVQPMLPADQFMTKVLADLSDAEKLLKDYDPIITEGVKNEEIEDDGLSHADLYYRQIRLNYYAVKALQARAYLWMGDKTNAYNVAKKQIIDAVTSADLEVFPWTTRAQVTSDSKPDYMFSSEVMFALYNSKRYNSYQTVYFAQALTTGTARHTFFGEGLTNGSKIESFYDDDNDIRLKQWEVVEPTDAEKQEAGSSTASNTLVLNKFKDLSGMGSELRRYMVPMIRLSEIYLIASESAPTESEARSLLNTVRRQRDCSSIKDEDDYDNALTYEMAREMLAEGQLFYFYKRRGATTLIGGDYTQTLDWSTWDYVSVYNKTYTMNKANYVVPVPKVEVDKRVNIE